jgi:hypothetical protein
MSNFEGVVNYISEKPYKGVKLYSFTLKGQDGFFRTGETKPKIKVGSYVTFEAEEDARGNRNVDIESIKGTVRAPDGTTKSETITEKNQDKVVDFKAIAEKAKQQSIHFQAAHKVAVDVTNIAITQGLLKLPATPAKGYDALKKAVFALADEIYDRYEAGRNAPVASVADEEEVEVIEEE